TCPGRHRGRALRFSGDGTTLAAGAIDGTLAVYDAERCGHARSLDGHVGEVIDVDFDPSGQHLVSAGADGEARVWDLATGHLVSQVHGAHTQARAVRFSPDGTMLAVGGLNGTVRIWDLAGTALATFELASPTLVLDWQPG